MDIIGYYGYEKLEPTKLKVNINGDYDIDMKQAEVHVEIDSSWCESEKGGLIALDNFLNSTLEIKNHQSALEFNSLFIEYNTLFESENELKESGIATSKADKWYIVIWEMKIELPTEFLKWIYTNRNTLNLEEKTSHDQSHQSTGFIVPMGLIIPLLKQYKDELDRQRIADIYKKSKLKKQ